MTLESVTLTAIIPGQAPRSVTLTPETRARIDAATGGRTVDPATGEIAEPSVDDAGKHLARRAEAEHAKGKDSGWGLAQLAAEAKNAQIKDWASIIGIPPRKSARRVYEWAQTYEWAEAHDLLAWRSDLDFGFFEIARKSAKVLRAADVIEMLDSFRQEKGATAESFEAELRDLGGEPDVDPTKKWKRWSAELYGQVDAEQPTVADCLSGAAKLLAEAAERRANQKGAQA